MKKRLSLISCFFVAGFGVNAQTSIEESQNIAVPASVEETIRWDKYGITSGAKKNNVLSPVNFGSRATSSAGTVLGTSQYDLMTNAAIDNRFVSHSDGTFSAGFIMSSQGDPYANRGTGYLYHDGTSWTVKTPANRIESERVGWASIMYTGNGDEIVISHTTASNQLIMLKRNGKGAGAWTETKDPTGAKVAPTVGSGYLIWPRAVVGGPSNNTVHLIALTEPVAATGSAFAGQLVGGMDGALVYSRSDDGGATWTVKNKILKGIDASVYTGIGGDSYAITADGNNVAIAVFHRFGDVRVVKSSDNGRTWNTHIPLDFQRDAFDLGDFAITDTPTTSDNTGDLIIDKNGMVHVFFGTWRWNDDDITDNPPMYNTFPLANGLAYWKESYGDNNHQRLFNFQDVNADGVVGIVGYPNNFDGLTNYGGKSVCSFPSVGMNSSGDLFLKFTNLMEDGSSTGGKLYNNGSRHFRHEWVTRSNDGGCSWSAPKDMTDAGAGFEECVYGVVPKKIDSKFRMIYMEDGAPGTAVGPETHAVGNNEMVYLEVNASSISTAKDICITTIFGSNELCPGDSAVLDASASCGTAYTWKDQFGTTLSSIASLNITTTGNYTCDIMTACGLQQESFEVVRPSNGQGPKISVSSSVSQLCATGSQAVLTVNASSFGSNGSIIWDRGIPGTVDTFSITSPGTYIVEVANCAGSTIDTIIVDTVDAVNATITGAQFLCPGEQSTLSVPENPDGTYTWKDGGGATIGSTRTVTVNASGTYTVDVTACSSALTGSNSIVVSAEPAPTAAIAIVNGGSATVCIDADGSIDLLATGQTNASFKWSNGGTGSLISIPTNVIGTQNITTYSFNSCGDSIISNSLTIEVVALPNEPLLSESNNVITSGTSTGVKWYFDESRGAGWQFTGETGATFNVDLTKYKRNGTVFGASITDLSSGCESEIALLDGFQVGLGSVIANEESIAIFPNPNTGEFNINLSGISGNTTVELTINNSVGQVVYETIIDVNSNHSEPVSLKGLDKGVYFLNVSNGAEKTTHRIVVR